MAAAVSLIEDESEYLDKLFEIGEQDGDDMERVQQLTDYVVGLLGMDRITAQVARMRSGEVPMPPGLPELPDYGLMVGAPEGVYPGSRKYSCFMCQADVWISPASQHTVAELSLRIACVDCFMQMSRNAEEPIEVAVHADALAEFENWQKRN